MMQLLTVLIMYMFSGQATAGQGVDDSYLVAKFNNPQEILHGNVVGGSSTSDNGRSITIDSSNNVYNGGVSDVGVQSYTCKI